MTICEALPTFLSFSRNEFNELNYKKKTNACTILFIILHPKSRSIHDYYVALAGDCNF